MANLITNGTFHWGNTTGWEWGDRTYNSANAGCVTGGMGDGCFAFQNEGVGGIRFIKQFVRQGIVPGKTYTLTYNALRYNRYDAWARIDYVDTNGNWQYINFPSAERYLIHNKYVKLGFQFTVPYNARPNELTVWILAGADAYDGYSTLLVDNVELDDGQGIPTSNLQVSVSASPSSTTVGSRVAWQANATGNVGAVEWYHELYSPSGFKSWAYSNYVSTIVDEPGTWYVWATANDALTNRAVTGGYVTVNAGGSTTPTPIGFYYSSNAYLNDSQRATNAQCIYNYLRSRGWSKNAICAMLGNFEKESTINPGIWGGLVANDLSRPFGLPQWKPASTYVTFANANGYELGAMDWQLDRLDWEAVTGQGPKYSIVAPYNMTFATFKSSTQPVDYLTKVFMYNYEKSGSSSEAERIGYANKWWNSLA